MRYSIIFTFYFMLSSLSPQAATFVVDNNSDLDNLAAYTLGDGTNSLRKCIRLANANAGADIINFNISGSTTIINTVAGGGAWFNITSPVTINGYSQAGALAGSPIIELDGAALGRWYAMNLSAGSAGSSIRGLIIYGCNMGVRMSSTTNNNQIAGCWIGVDNTGNMMAPNPITEHGLRIEGSSNNTIGGTGGLIDRNVIAGCAMEGIRFQSPVSTNNTVINTYLGIGANGLTSLGNRNGIFAQLSTDLVIGSPNNGNVISANNERGLFFIDCDNFSIQSNKIGLSEDGMIAVGNNITGIEIISGSDIGLVGGTTLAERNYISGNNHHALLFNTCNNVTIQGNYIGVAIDGVSPRPNAISGIIGVNCEFMTVGGSSLGAGNVIASNIGHGVSIYGAGSRNSIIQGNLIGLGADGITPLGNGLLGIEVNENEDTQIGGTSPNERNVVANNTASGIMIINSPRTIVEGNYVGIDATGLVDMGNQQHGIAVDNSTDVRIGGTSWGCRNVISGNNLNGIELFGNSANAIIKGNFIGVGADGSSVIKNDENGIRSIQNAQSMIVGGPTLVERNVISGNGQFVVDADPDNGIVGDGVRILGTNNHIIENNYVGTDSTGTIGIGNHWAGISLNDGALNNLVIDNLVSDNRNEGIWIYDSDNNQIFRNTIGEDANGNPLGNWDFGLIILVGGSFGNIVGGSPANANIIAHTRGERPTANGDGVTIAADAGNENTITFNNIHCNAGMGILRQGSANESQAAPIVTISNPNDISGTGNNGNTIHVYQNITTDGGAACDCEGEVYIGSTTVSGGSWTLVHNLGLNTTAADAVTTTQTTISGSTSEFSNCIPPIILAVDLLNFKGNLFSKQSILLSWQSQKEEQSDYYLIERSLNAVDWQPISEQAAAGYSNTLLNYGHLDQDIDPKQRGYYYRLKDVELDGDIAYSPTIFVELENSPKQPISIYPNPANTTIQIVGLQTDLEEYQLINLLGQDLSNQFSLKTINKHSISIDLHLLPSGMYYLIINGGERKKAFIKE